MFILPYKVSEEEEMSGTYRKNDEKLIEKKGEWIRQVTEKLYAEGERIERNFYHYTPLNNLFNILEGDSFWVSNMCFSNDDSEGIVLREKGYTELDNYIVCFCDHPDQLSQWRGYCPSGGASIELALNKIHGFSVLHADYDTSKKYELYYNTPLPVIYVKNDKSNLNMALKAIEKTNINASGNYRFAPAETRDIIPYLKNDKFSEERELRLAFINWDGSLYDCIRFRILSNGVKTPYMVVKIGNIGENLTRCSFDVKSITDDYFKTMNMEGKDEIWIPEGSNQESIFNEVNEQVQDYNKRKKKNEFEIHIFCEGHLPIKKITISPMSEQQRIKEQVKRYCYSKYWLRNVEVVCSEIPYVATCR